MNSHDDAVTATVGVYYTTQIVYVPQTAGLTTITSGCASLVLANGAPNLPLFGKNGTITVSVIDAYGNVLTVLSGSYSKLGQTPGQP